MPDAVLVVRPTLVGRRRRFLLRRGLVTRRRPVRRGLCGVFAVGHEDHGMSHHRPSNAASRRHVGRCISYSQRCISYSQQSRHHSGSDRLTNQTGDELQRDTARRSPGDHGLFRDRFGHLVSALRPKLIPRWVLAYSIAPHTARRAAPRPDSVNDRRICLRHNAIIRRHTHPPHATLNGQADALRRAASQPQRLNAAR